MTAPDRMPIQHHLVLQVRKIVPDAQDSIPMAFFVENTDRCFKNHAQSPDVLRARGGLSYSEAYAILADVAWSSIPEEEALYKLRRAGAFRETPKHVLSRPKSSTERAVHDVLDADTRVALACYTRNGRWGTCGACPRSGDGSVYPEFCADTGRDDHWLALEKIVDLIQARRPK